MTSGGEPEKSLKNLCDILARILIADAPAGWREIRHKIMQSGNTSASASSVTMHDGSIFTFGGASFESFDATDEIRALLYRPGRGAWYMAECVVLSDGRITMDYDYVNEPQWDIDVVPATYVEDLEMFPRDLEHQPDWLREKLRQAGA